METIGNKIKNLRIEKNLTQKELANILNIGQSSICEWEKNNYEPTASAIKLLAIFFEVSSDYLLGLEEEDGSKKNNYIFNIQNNYNK